MSDRVARLAADIRDAKSGVACAVLEAGELALHLSPGADELTMSSVFEIGSITKTMTGLLLAVFLDRGVVHLDDPIGTWIEAGPAGAVTLGQLATHTSGLPRLTKTMIKRARSVPDNPYRDTTADDVLRDLRALRSRTPGPILYSNAGYMVLGHVLSVVGGQSYEGLVRNELFRPLGMRQANFGDDSDPARVPGYREGRPTPHWDFQLNGAGGVEATIGDMASYLQAHADPASSELRPALELAQATVARDDAYGIGLGWHLSDGVTWHGGGTYGFASFIGFDRATRTGVVVLSNGGHRPDVGQAGFGLLADLAAGRRQSS
jgi:D-alanyl-D-alanine-carboxypeptidase/D-alanyl-D-alanine-endopeptidase